MQVPSCPAGALSAKSKHDRRYRHTFCNAAEGIDVSTRGLGRRGDKCTYMASLDEGEGLAAEEGIAVGSIGVLLPEIAG